MWTTKLMVDGAWRGDVEETPAIAAKRARHLGFRGYVADDVKRGAPAPGRYHLYVSYACPFAHRTILAHALKRLNGVVGVSVLHPRWNTADGWVFGDTGLSTCDLAGNGFTHLHEAFSASAPDYTGRVTVPVLWDCKTKRIVSDESLHITLILNDAFEDFGADRSVDLYPRDLRFEIDMLVSMIADAVAVGVYRVGGALDQAGYDLAEASLFDALDCLEERLSDGRPYLHGETLTLSDVTLFTPLVRFEPVYRPLFRALRKSLGDCSSLSGWMQRLLTNKVIAGTVRIDHVLAHYYDDWAPRNPRIVPRWSWPKNWPTPCR